MKKIAKITIMIALIILCSACSMKGTSQKEKIFLLVKNNQEIILEDIKNNNYSRTKKIEGIENINNREEDGYVEFLCGGKGLVPSSSYYGFYYSENNEPNRMYFFNEDENFIPEGKGYIYRENDGDNVYYTEKIVDYIYYYEMHT